MTHPEQEERVSNASENLHVAGLDVSLRASGEYLQGTEDPQKEL